MYVHDRRHRDLGFGWPGRYTSHQPAPGDLGSCVDPAGNLDPRGGPVDALDPSLGPAGTRSSRASTDRPHYRSARSKFGTLL